MFNLLKRIKGSPSPKPKYDEVRTVVYTYELELLRVAAFNKGERKDAINKLKAFQAWRLSNGK
jgi:hypothetical protein